MCWPCSIDRHRPRAYLGYSLGGRVGFSLAATYPQRMLSSSVLRSAPRADAGCFDRVFFPGCIEVLESGGMAGFLDSVEPGKAVDADTRAALARDDPRALAAYMRESQDDAGVPEAAVAAIDLPTLLLVGSEDDERLGAGRRGTVMPSASIWGVLPGATHGETLQHPACPPRRPRLPAKQRVAASLR